MSLAAAGRVKVVVPACAQPPLDVAGNKCKEDLTASGAVYEAVGWDPAPPPHRIANTERSIRRPPYFTRASPDVFIRGRTADNQAKSREQNRIFGGLSRRTTMIPELVNMPATPLPCRSFFLGSVPLKSPRNSIGAVVILEKTAKKAPQTWVSSNVDECAAHMDGRKFTASFGDTDQNCFASRETAVRAKSARERELPTSGDRADLRGRFMASVGAQRPLPRSIPVGFSAEPAPPLSPPRSQRKGATGARAVFSRTNLSESSLPAAPLPTLRLGYSGASCVIPSAPRTEPNKPLDSSNRLESVHMDLPSPFAPIRPAKPCRPPSKQYCRRKVRCPQKSLVCASTEIGHLEGVADLQQFESNEGPCLQRWLSNYPSRRTSLPPSRTHVLTSTRPKLALRRNENGLLPKEHSDNVRTVSSVRSKGVGDEPIGSEAPTSQDVDEVTLSKEAVPVVDVNVEVKRSGLVVGKNVA